MFENSQEQGLQGKLRENRTKCSMNYTNSEQICKEEI